MQNGAQGFVSESFYYVWRMANVQLGFRKERGIGHHIANIPWLLVCTKEFPQKTILALLLIVKSLTI